MKKFFKQHCKGLAIFAAAFLLFHYLFLFSAPVNFWLHYKGEDKKYYDSEVGWYWARTQKPLRYQQEELPLSGFSIDKVTVYRYRDEDITEDSDLNRVTRVNGHGILVDYNNGTGRELKNLDCIVIQWLDGKWYNVDSPNYRFAVPTDHPIGEGQASTLLYNESHAKLYYEDFEAYKLNTGLPFYGVFRAVVSFEDHNGQKYRVFSDPFFISPYWVYSSVE